MDRFSSTAQGGIRDDGSLSIRQALEPNVSVRFGSEGDDGYVGQDVGMGDSPDPPDLRISNLHHA